MSAVRALRDLVQIPKAAMQQWANRLRKVYGIAERSPIAVPGPVTRFFEGEKIETKKCLTHWSS